AGDPQLEQRLDADTAPLERQQKSSACHSSLIDQRWRGNSVFLAERPDPPAARVVQMRGDRTNRALCFAGKRRVPERHWQLLDQVGGDEAVRSPRANDRRPQIRGSAHSFEVRTLPLTRIV